MRSVSIFMAMTLTMLGACGGDDDDEPVDTSAVTTSTSVSTSTTVEAVTTSSSSAASLTTRKCKTVGFTPNSEDAASDVTARGLSCAEAERFVEVAGRRTSSGGPDRVEVEGYTCERTRTEQEPLPRSYYSCTSGSKTVTFVRS